MKKLYIFTLLINFCLLGSAEVKNCFTGIQKSQTKHYPFGYFYFMETNVCKICNEEKPLSDFRVSKKMVKGHENSCKKCKRKTKPFEIESFENEIWKDVVGYEGVYMVSNIGRVKSIAREIKHEFTNTQFIKERILSKLNQEGYSVVGLSRGGVKTRVAIHRLMGLAFISNPENKPSINHINGVHSDNRIENLEWATWKEQSHHRFNVLKRGNAKGADCGNSRKCFQYGLSGEFVNEFACVADAMRETGIGKGIYGCCEGRRATNKGYIWSYIDTRNPKV